MMQQNKSEKGQALVLIVFAMIGMLALVGLAMDGGQTFSDRRRGQNAADAAALAAALKYQQDPGVSNADLTTLAQAAAAINGYDGSNSVITVSPSATATGDCPGDAAGKNITVTVVSTVKTWFSSVVGVKEV